MTAPFLYMRNRVDAGAQCAVFKEQNRQLIQVGNDFGTGETNLATCPRHRSENRVIRWGNDILALNADKIWKYDTLTAGSGGTGDWEVFYQFPNHRGTAFTCLPLGLVPITRNGEPVLLTAYPDSSNNAGATRFVFIHLDGTIEESPVVDLLSSWDYDVNNHLWNGVRQVGNELFFEQNTFVGYLHVMQLDTFSWTRIKANNYSGSATPCRSQVVVYEDNYYSLEQTGAQAGNPTQPGGLGGGDVGLYRRRKDNGQFWQLGLVFGLTNHVVNQGGSYAMMEIDDKFYVFGPNNNASSYLLFEVELSEDRNSVANITNLTSLLPAAITSLDPATECMAHWRIDENTNGPDNPIYELEFNTGQDGARRLWTWNNAPSGSDWTNNGSAMAGRTYSWIDDKDFGPRIDSLVAVSQPKLSISDNGLYVDVEFEIFGPSTGLDGLVKLDLFYTSVKERPNLKASIVSTSLGTLNGKTVEGLSPGDVVVVRWDAVGDGLNADSTIRTKGRVFVQ